MNTIKNTLSSFAVASIVAMTCAIGSHVARAHDSRGVTDSKHRIVKRSPLVEKVRIATRRYQDIKVAIAEGWTSATPCVSGPNEGAMGVHYVLPERIGDGTLQADQPEALIYEPLPGGKHRLVGVEFIVLAEQWNTLHPEAQPTLEGHLLHLIGEPNRYRLPAFYELHVWAWEFNPSGALADWNTNVSCDAQSLN